MRSELLFHPFLHSTLLRPFRPNVCLHYFKQHHHWCNLSSRDVLMFIVIIIFICLQTTWTWIDSGTPSSSCPSRVKQFCRWVCLSSHRRDVIGRQQLSTRFATTSVPWLVDGVIPVVRVLLSFHQGSLFVFGDDMNFLNLSVFFALKTSEYVIELKYIWCCRTPDICAPFLQVKLKVTNIDTIPYQCSVLAVLRTHWIFNSLCGLPHGLSAVSGLIVNYIYVHFDIYFTAGN